MELSIHRVKEVVIENPIKLDIGCWTRKIVIRNPKGEFTLTLFTRDRDESEPRTPEGDVIADYGPEGPF